MLMTFFGSLFHISAIQQTCESILFKELASMGINLISRAPYESLP